MNKPWFDAHTGTLMLDEYVARLPAFQKIMEDGVVTDVEIAEHAQRTEALLRQLEAMLSPEAKAVATDALCALIALYTLERTHAHAHGHFAAHTRNRRSLP